MRNDIRAAAAVCVLCSTGGAMGQSLFQRPNGLPSGPASGGSPGASVPAAGGGGGGRATPLTGAGGGYDPAEGDALLRQYSLIAVSAPPPRAWQKHDMVQVIINESTVQKMEQKLDTKKDYNLAAELSQFPSLQALLEAQLNNGDSTAGAKLDVSSNQKFKGDGKAERKDSLQARIAARVLEVKPNGVMVIEARETISMDEEESTLVLSGVCNPKDITTSDTVQSSQLAELTIKIVHSGEVRKSAKKGIIPRALETVFNF